MSERIVLVCEWCEKSPNIRRTITGPKTKDVLLVDFCFKHDRKFMQLIQPRQRQKAGVTHHVSQRKMSTDKDVKEFQDKVLHAISKDGWIAPIKVKQHLKVKPWKVTAALKVLLKEGKVERQGRGRSAKYRRK